MFGFDVKQIFTERIYEIIFVLCSLHLGAVMVSFLLKWLHPYLKSCSVMHNSHDKVDPDDECLKGCQLQSFFNNYFNKKEDKVTRKNCYESNTTISEEDYVNIIKYLETFVDVSSISQEITKKQYNKGNVLNELSLEIDNAINIRKLTKDNLKKRRSTSEAQTNITLSPMFQTDCSSPKLMVSCQPKSCDVPLHLSESSDSFESVCSNYSNFETSKHMPINYSLGIYDRITIEEKSRKINKSETVKHDSLLLDVNSLTSKKKVLKTHVQSLGVENHNDYEKQVSQENKILEIAINEFENELKPIKDQIKVLKECLHSFDCCETDNSFVSDLSSSISDHITRSECYSDDVSTTHTSDLKSFSSKRCKMFEQKSPLRGAIQYNMCKPTLYENTPLISKSNSPSNSYKMFQSVNKYNRKCPKEICILGVRQSANETSLKKRSPIADMYIKLSHCSSQTVNFVKNNSYKQNGSDKSVTCHINLNFNLGALTLSSTSIKNCIKESKMQPLLSEPEDILGEISDTGIQSSKPEKNNNTV